jgi:hypothetical protein
MWNYIFNVIDVILKLGSPKRKTHKIHMINDPSKTFENICFGDNFFFEKQTKIAIHMHLWKYGQIWTIQKSLTIEWLRFSNKRFLTWVYHFIFYHILNSNKKIGMWINIKFSICDVPIKWLVHIFQLQKSITTSKWIFYQ